MSSIIRSFRRHHQVVKDSILVSICIPVRLRNSIDVAYLNELLTSIARQSFQSFEIIISIDATSRIHDLSGILLKEQSELWKKISIVRNSESGISRNTNFAVSAAKGEIVKIMFQDDFFINNLALSEIVQAMQDSKKSWLVCATDHLRMETNSRGPVLVPRLDAGLYKGINRVSSPSVVAFIRKSFLPFSNDLSIMMDCEWYIRMTHNFGKPLILSEVCIMNRIHRDQAQHSLGNLISQEIAMVIKTHSKSKLRKVKCSCLRDR